MKNTFLLFAILIAILVLSACTAGSNPMEKKANPAGKVAGFLKGLWHGMISPITFVISIFTSRIRFYEVFNNGNWYNFGFVLGAGLFLSGGILGKKSKKKK